MSQEDSALGKRVLLIEDDTFTAVNTSRRLKHRGYEVKVASDGETALQLLEEHEFDVVLLDMLLPGMSGEETLSWIRERKSQTELPVIIVTALEEVDSVVNGLKNGANDYITKPANLDVMTARIETQATLKRLQMESIRSKESEALSALIITYHHELNNPLAIALGHLRLMRDKIPASPELDRIEKALNRMTDVVRKISGASHRPVETVPYSNGAGKLLKLNND